MPPKSTPGIFVEEMVTVAGAIAGVSTATAGFVGPTRTGPLDTTPELLTSFADFVRRYGGLGTLGSALDARHVAHAAWAFFNEGGTRLYVARAAGATTVAASPDLVKGGRSRFVARFPGTGGNGSLLLALQASPASLAAARSAVEGSILRIRTTRPLVVVKRGGSWRTSAGAGRALTSKDEVAGLELIAARVEATDVDGHVLVCEGLGLDPAHPRFLGKVLASAPATRDAPPPLMPVVFEVAKNVTAFELLAACAPAAGSAAKTIVFSGGTEAAPTLEDYRRALARLEPIADIAIVAAPGATELVNGREIALELIAHATRPRAYRFAVVDVPQRQTPEDAGAFKAAIDSGHAALYYPWVVVQNPAAAGAAPPAGAEVTLPPSGFICGIYARSDSERGVWKAPANQAVRSALRFERALTAAEEEGLNARGINCLRSFPGRGQLVWGARTTSADPEWKYINLRRYVTYLEHSIDLGTQWAAFEPNGEKLWARVREAVGNFLRAEWRRGALLGEKPEQAFFVKCDRTTMTQDDIDHGRLVCLIGIAVLKPAEFILVRIGQWTAKNPP